MIYYTMQVWTESREIFIKKCSEEKNRRQPHFSPIYGRDAALLKSRWIRHPQLRSGNAILVHRLNQIADRAEPVVAGRNESIRIFHFAVIEIAAPVSQGKNIFHHGFPSVIAEAIRLCPALVNKNWTRKYNYWT